MIPHYTKWFAAALVSGLALPFVVTACTYWMNGALPEWLAVTVFALVSVFLFCGIKAGQKQFAKLVPSIEAESANQVTFLDSMSGRNLAIAIVASAMLSLFLELAVIRWQASVFEFFAFYKNFGLLACLAGLGTGYALAGIPRIPLVCSVAVLGYEMLLLTAMRHGLDINLLRSLITSPITEQVNMGLSDKVTNAEFIAVYSLLSLTFILTVLAFVPIGQLCGRLMNKGNPLSAYGFNLLGSLLGIVLMTLLGYASTPPLVWFSIGFLVIVAFCAASKKSVLIASAWSIASLIVLAWPNSFGYEVVFSPYQVLERGPDQHGWSMIRAAGQYYQRMQDLSPAARVAYPDIKDKGAYYDLPYAVKSQPESVAILGAGTGNDVAAALRAQAKHVDAVEIDPAILAIGSQYHPEKPYSDPRVHAIVTDARAHLRSTKNTYDMIVFGLVDSHSLVSHASSLRIDSYVYTLEALKEARSRLRPGGVLSLSFSIATPALARKIYVMLDEVFGKPPLCLCTANSSYDVSLTFLQNKEGTLTVPAAIAEQNKLKDMTNLVAQATGAAVDPSSDDWPFFYMPQRKWPISYIPMLLLVIGATYAINRSLGRQSGSLQDLDFFMLGAGFMLIETKAITELGLVYGNTWYVVAIVIASIIMMAYCANLLVQKAQFKNTSLAYLLMILALGGGLYIACHGGYPADIAGNIAATMVLTCPLMFSGIVFSSLISNTTNLPRAMSMNLLGAMLGGVLEYNAMYFGYRALYVVAIVIYILAYLCSRRRAKGSEQQPLE